MREYKLYDGAFGGVLVVKCERDNDCLFCKNCTDVFWDYTNGPYMTICKLGEDRVNDNCRYFEEVEDNAKKEENR